MNIQHRVLRYQFLFFYNYDKIFWNYKFRKWFSLKTLIYFNDTKLVDSIYQKLIHLHAGECLSSIRLYFILWQPQIIKFFVQILLSLDHLNELLEFLISLLQFLPLNLQACADCNLYIFILEFLENVKFQEKLSNVVRQLILSLYSLLSVQHSTKNSVLRFISLFVPVNERAV